MSVSVSFVTPTSPKVIVGEVKSAVSTGELRFCSAEDCSSAFVVVFVSMISINA